MRSATVVVGEVRLTVSEERGGGREKEREGGREGGRERGAREDEDEALTLRRQKKESKAPLGTA